MNSPGEKTAVTWMIPVLNGMPYLPATLDSIQRQSFQNFKVVVWDNGSTDGTVEELQKWIPNRLPGKIVTRQPLALGASRAAMVSACDTEFGALIDADDINFPLRLEKQIDFLTRTPTVAVLGTQINRMDSAGTDLGLFSDFPLVHDKIVQEMLVSNPIAQPSVVFRNSAILQSGNFREVKVEDYDLWLRVAAAGFRFANLQESLVHYRVHPASTTQKQMASDVLHRYVLEHLVNASPALFDCDGATMRRLRERKHSHAIIPLRRIAEKISAESNPWESPIFYAAARSMIHETDVRSRIAAAVENRGISGGLKELESIASGVVRRIKRKLFGTKKENINADN